MKRNFKKLRLTRETLSVLNGKELSQIQGGVETDSCDTNFTLLCTLGCGTQTKTPSCVAGGCTHEH